jgi:hypothetical protein
MVGLCGITSHRVSTSPQSMTHSPDGVAAWSCHIEQHGIGQTVRYRRAGQAQRKPLGHMGREAAAGTGWVGDTRTVKARPHRVQGVPAWLPWSSMVVSEVSRL